MRTRKIPDPLKARNSLQVVMICDSIGKYVDREKMFGQKRVAIRRLGTAESAKATLRTWGRCNAVQHFIIHLGINDIREGNDESRLVTCIKKCIDMVSEKCPNASVIFSEILLVGGTQRTINDKVRRVNDAISNHCKTSSRYIYAKHTALKENDSLYEDDIHINKDSGTRYFVADIMRAARNGLQHKNHRTNGAQGVNRSPSVPGIRSLAQPHNLSNALAHPQPF